MYVFTADSAIVERGNLTSSFDYDFTLCWNIPERCKGNTVPQTSCLKTVLILRKLAKYISENGIILLLDIGLYI